MYKVPSAKRRKRKFSPLNLIPILDVVFILIFFLLSTSQIVKFFEIGSDLPIYKMSSQDVSEKKDLFNLEVKLNEESLSFINTVSGEVLHKVTTSWEQEDFYQTINDIVISLKKENEKESRVTLKVSESVEYQKLIKIMDNLRKNNSKSGQGEKLFTQIMFNNK